MRSIISTSLLAITALAVGTPAFAAPSGAAYKTVLKYDAKTQKYCLTEAASTGSRIGRVTCLTSAQWTAQGLEMPKTVVLAAQ
ncbi:hypothetical protein [Sphingomonas faeni]|uniref:hypothetical protein n=1 Tax=Sphingomonas faeni TaxID=185950 RepID=UPI00335DB7D7